MVGVSERKCVNSLCLSPALASLHAGHMYAPPLPPPPHTARVHVSIPAPTCHACARGPGWHGMAQSIEETPPTRVAAAV